jgi:hypothetical protein
MIEYRYTEGDRNANVLVRLDGKIVGEIRKEEGVWRYYPKGSKDGGEGFNTLRACLKSLE